LSRVRAAAVVAVFVVAAASCGGSTGGSRAARLPAGRAADPPRVAALTEVLTFQAFDDRGLLPNLVRTTSVDGACTGGSLDLPGRADAWRCTSGGSVLDPCFSAEGSSELACVPDPFTTAVTMLQISGRLPRGNRNDPAHPPWFLELADGRRCGPLPAGSQRAAAVAGAAPTYTCTGGAEVFGDPDASRPVWTARVGPGDRASAEVAVDVKTAWY
jgi:hypothetical protein